MSYDGVRKYFEEIGLIDHITVHESTADNVAHAAATLGITEAEIAKTLSFLVGGKPVLIVMAGDCRVNSSKFKAKFHEKPSMISRDDVEEFIGHKPGGVCPFAIKEGVPVYLDVSMKRFEFVHAAGGSDLVTIKLSIDELEKYTGYVEWVDVGKIPESI